MFDKIKAKASELIDEITKAIESEEIKLDDEAIGILTTRRDHVIALRNEVDAKEKAKEASANPAPEPEAAPVEAAPAESTQEAKGDASTPVDVPL